MPRLTLADVLHNLPYSLAAQYWILDLQFRNWDLSSPLMGSWGLTGGTVVIELTPGGLRRQGTRGDRKTYQPEALMKANRFLQGDKAWR